MHSTPELVAVIQRDRERTMEQDRLARLVERVKACCRPSVIDRLARALRPAPTAC